MNQTVLKIYFTKQKHDTVFYRNYKKFDNLKFKKALNRESMKHDVNNIDYEIVHGTVLSIANVFAPLKKKHLHATFVTKKFRKAVIKRAALKNTHGLLNTFSRPWERIRKKRTEAAKAAYIC